MISKFVCILIILIFLVGILILIVKSKYKKIERLEKEIDEIDEDIHDLEIKNEFLLNELKVEKERNDELVKKLSAISNMSIDDVLHELQNNKNG
jgi:predicted PurR-regulated permease PerM